MPDMFDLYKKGVNTPALTVANTIAKPVLMFAKSMNTLAGTSSSFPTTPVRKLQFRPKKELKNH